MGWNNKRGKNKDSYQFVVFKGRDKDGKKIEERKTVNLSHITTEKKRDLEAHRLFAVWENEVKGGQFVKNEKITFREITEIWLKDYANIKLKSKTLLEYKNLLKRINYAIGNVKVVNINTQMLLEFYQNLREVGIRQNKKYAPKEKFEEIINGYGFTYMDIEEKVNVTDSIIRSLKSGTNIQDTSALKISKGLKINISKLFTEVNGEKVLTENTILHYHRLISSILNFAISLNYLHYNPAPTGKLAPTLPDRVPKVFTIPQTVVILYNLRDKPIKYRTIIVLGIFTGMRIGELAALTWKDIDFETGVITVNKSLQYIPNQGLTVKVTKTGKPRYVSIPQAVIDLIQEYKIWQDKEKENLGDLWYKSNYIFTTQEGHYMHPSTASKWLVKFLKEWNKIVMENPEIAIDKKEENLLPENSFHALRHTNATILYSLGVALREISGELGHKKLSTTSDIYIEFIHGANLELANKLGNALGDKI